MKVAVGSLNRGQLFYRACGCECVVIQGSFDNLIARRAIHACGDKDHANPELKTRSSEEVWTDRLARDLDLQFG